MGSELEVARSMQFNATQSIAHQSTNGRESRTSRVNGYYDLESAKDRIEHLELQIEALQEHIEGLETEVETMETTKSAIQSSFVQEKQQLSNELHKEREKTKGLMENLTRLEKLVNELEKERHLRSNHCLLNLQSRF